MRSRGRLSQVYPCTCDGSERCQADSAIQISQDINMLSFSTSTCLPNATTRPQPSTSFVSRKQLPTALPKRRAHFAHRNGQTKRLCMTATETQRSTVPKRVRDANVAIVGGGPCGLFAAISLAERGVPVTVLERNDFNSFSAPRSYVLGVSSRGRRALLSVEGLFEHVAEEGLEYSNFYRLAVQPDSTIQCSKVPRSGGNVAGLNVLITRMGLVKQLRSFAERYDCVRIVDEARVNDVRFGEDGDIQIEWQVDSDVQMMRTKLVLACDGKNSVVQKALSEAGGDTRKVLRSANGLGLRSVDSPSSGLLIKSFVLDERQINNWLEEVEDTVEKTASERPVISIRGQRKGRPFREHFNAGVFPLSGGESRLAGGYLASVVRPANHAVWKLNDVEEGYRLFEANFPQMQVRECVTSDDMKSFIEARPLRFPSVSRPQSLVVHVNAQQSQNGTSESAGIVFLGDAAHCFPPDAGQGVNAAFQDVQVLMQVMDTSNVESSIESVLKSYESEREEEVEGLLRVVRFNNPYMYEQNRVCWLANMLNRALRHRLSQLFPGVIHPSIGPLLIKGLAYREIARLVDTTTLRLYAGVVSLLVAFYGIAALVQL